jgi:hypothetical protein
MPDDEAPWASATQLGKPNRGQHMALPGDSTGSRQGPRVPSVGKPAGQRKGTGASPTLGDVVGPKTTVAEEALVQGLGDSGTGHHDDYGGGSSGRQQSAARPRTPQ